MLRIIQEADSSKCVTLKVEGRVVSSWVSLVEHKCRTCLQHNGAIVLDFSQVTCIDAQGLVMLKRFASPQLLLINKSTVHQGIVHNRGRSVACTEDVKEI